MPQLSALEVWKKITEGQEPEAFQRAGVSPIGGSQASGTINNLSVTVADQPGRVDLNLMPASNAQTAGPPPQIDDFESTLKLILSLSRSLMSDLKLTRVAMVSTFAKHCESAEEAVEAVVRSSEASFPFGTGDLIYQYNVRRTFNSAQYDMNRIHTWSVGVKQFFTFTAGFTVGRFTAPEAINYPVAVLKLDYNSATQVDISSHAAGMLEDIGEELRMSATKHLSEI